MALVNLNRIALSVVQPGQQQKPPIAVRMPLPAWIHLAVRPASMFPSTEEALAEAAAAVAAEVTAEVQRNCWTLPWPAILRESLLLSLL